jgi:hypothetical protein
MSAAVGWCDTRPMTCASGSMRSGKGAAMTPVERQTRPKATAKNSYGASPIKRNRRTKVEIDKIKEAIYKLLKAEQPMTVRQLYYRLVSAQVIQKTEAEYDTVCRLLAHMRRSGELPFSWLADATRW